ncbi:MAG: hypothetical protein Q9170_003309 [Blastenia crenularia]
MKCFSLLRLIVFFFSLLPLAATSPINATLVSRKDYEPGDTLGRTMCFCTNNNDFTQWAGAPNDGLKPAPPPASPYAFQSVPESHEVAFVYKFDYYNHRLDHHFALHALDKCSTASSKLPNACLDWRSQHRDWCHTFHTAHVPEGVKYHQYEFCYQFRGDSFLDSKHRDFWTFYKDKRGLPRQRDWMASEGEKFDDICYHGSEANNMACDMNVGGG